MAETKAIFFPKVLRREVSFYLAGWTPASLDSRNVLFAPMATPAENGQGQYNVGYYSNARVDELIRRIGSEDDVGKRQEMITKAFKIDALDIGRIPLHQQPLVWGMQNNVEVVHLADDFNYLCWAILR